MTDITHLLSANKITKGQYDIYLIFEMTDVGRALYKKWIERYLLREDQTVGGFSNDAFAFMAGRVSFIQDIYREIEFVKAKIRESENV